MRGVLAAVVAMTGFASVTFTLAQTEEVADPAMAYKLAPYSGRATAGLAAALSQADATPADRLQADALARRALGQEPISVTAISTLALNAGVRGDAAGSRRLFSFAERLSRRDLQAQLLAIQDAVSRGDVTGALRHYDIALRCNPISSDLLFPVLASASADLTVRIALIHTLATKPSWASDFLSFAAYKGPDPRATAALFVGLHARGIPVAEAAHARVIDALVGGGRIDEAWTYYAAFHPGADRRRSRDPHFVVTTQTPSQFDWVPVNDGTLSTSIQGGAFEFTAPSTAAGPLLRQLELLPPGNYRLTGQSDGIAQAATARPYWQLTCDDGRELGRIDLTNSAQLGGRFAGMFIVSPECRNQKLMLLARASEAVSGLSGRIKWVQLVPAE